MEAGGSQYPWKLHSSTFGKTGVVSVVMFLLPVLIAVCKTQPVFYLFCKKLCNVSRNRGLVKVQNSGISLLSVFQFYWMLTMTVKQTNGSLIETNNSIQGGKLRKNGPDDTTTYTA